MKNLIAINAIQLDFRAIYYIMFLNKKIVRKKTTAKSMRYFNAFNLINGIGSQKIKMLSDFFPSGEAAWQAGMNELIQSGIGETAARKIFSARTKINPQKEWEKLEKENIRLLAFNQPAYPALLKEIPSAPYLLYLKGDFQDFNSVNMLAIVGSRKFSSYGKQVVENLTRDLARAGIVIVSGLALGIDTLAHLSALKENKQTFAVLGSSLEDEMIGPRSNFDLSRRVMENGCLLSEFPLGTAAGPGTFPARNRIMAGLTLGTLVVEAAEKSGSLITAELALEFNREVFAIPGSIFSPTSAGTNELIKRGAKPVTGINDILEELKIEKATAARETKKILPSSEEEKIILNLLSHEPTHIDRIVKLSKLKTNVASSCLTVMEMKGLIKDIGAQNYVAN